MREDKEFKQMLERRTGLEVILWDERLTTVAADRHMMESGIRRENRKQYVDEIAAVFILQGYLDSLVEKKVNSFRNSFIEWRMHRKVKFVDPDTGESSRFCGGGDKGWRHALFLATEEEDGDCDAYILKEVETKDEESVYGFKDDTGAFCHRKSICRAARRRGHCILRDK